MSALSVLPLPPVSHTYQTHYDIADLKANIDSYFKACDDIGRYYTLTELALYLNITRETLWAWVNESSTEKSHLLKRAREKILGQAEYQLRSGKGNVAGTIFWLKNVFNWADVTRTEDLTANKALDVLKAFVDRERIPSQPQAANVINVKDLTDSQSRSITLSDPLSKDRAKPLKRGKRGPKPKRQKKSDGSSG